MKQDKTSQKIDNEGVNTSNIKDGANIDADNMTETTDNVAEKATETAEDWQDKYLRLSAEFDNYRKRTLREIQNLISSGGERVISSLLPVVDDFGRALEAIEKSSDFEQLKQGVVLISNKLNDTLRAQGVTEIEALGKELDTDLHEAIAQLAAGNEHKGKIVDVTQKGYKLGDKVIRHSKVVVGE